MDVNFNEMQSNKLPDINYSKRLEDINKALKEMGMETGAISSEQAISVFNEITKDSNGNVNADDFALALAKQYDASIKSIDDLNKDYYYALTGIAFADGDGSSMSLEDLEIFQKEIEKYTNEHKEENTEAAKNNQGILEGLPDYFKQYNKNTASNRIKIDNNGNYYITADAFDKNKSDNIDCYSRLINNVYGYSYYSQEGKKLMEALIEANPDLANGMLIGQRVNLVNANEILNSQSQEQNDDTNENPQGLHVPSEQHDKYLEQLSENLSSQTISTILNDNELPLYEKLNLMSEAKGLNAELITDYFKEDDTFFVSAFSQIVNDKNYTAKNAMSLYNVYAELQGNTDIDENNNPKTMETYLTSMVALFEKAKETDELNIMPSSNSIAALITNTKVFNDSQKEELLKKLNAATGQSYAL